MYNQVLFQMHHELFIPYPPSNQQHLTTINGNAQVRFSTSSRVSNLVHTSGDDGWLLVVVDLSAAATGSLESFDDPQ